MFRPEFAYVSGDITTALPLCPLEAGDEFAEEEGEIEDIDLEAFKAKYSKYSNMAESASEELISEAIVSVQENERKRQKGKELDPRQSELANIQEEPDNARNEESEQKADVIIESATKRDLKKEFFAKTEVSERKTEKKKPEKPPRKAIESLEELAKAEVPEIQVEPEISMEGEKDAKEEQKTAKKLQKEIERQAKEIGKLTKQQEKEEQKGFKEEISKHEKEKQKMQKKIKKFEKLKKQQLKQRLEKQKSLDIQRPPAFLDQDAQEQRRESAPDSFLESSFEGKKMPDKDLSLSEGLDDDLELKEEEEVQEEAKDKSILVTSTGEVIKEIGVTYVPPEPEEVEEEEEKEMTKEEVQDKVEDEPKGFNKIKSKVLDGISKVKGNLPRELPKLFPKKASKANKQEDAKGGSPGEVPAVTVSMVPTIEEEKNESQKTESQKSEFQKNEFQIEAKTSDFQIEPSKTTELHIDVTEDYQNLPVVITDVSETEIELKTPSPYHLSTNEFLSDGEEQQYESFDEELKEKSKSDKKRRMKTKSRFNRIKSRALNSLPTMKSIKSKVKELLPKSSHYSETVSSTERSYQRLGLPGRRYQREEEFFSDSELFETRSRNVYEEMAATQERVEAYMTPVSGPLRPPRRSDYGLVKGYKGTSVPALATQELVPKPKRIPVRKIFLPYFLCISCMQIKQRKHGKLIFTCLYIRKIR